MWQMCPAETFPGGKSGGRLVPRTLCLRILGKPGSVFPGGKTLHALLMQRGWPGRRRGSLLPADLPPGVGHVHWPREHSLRQGDRCPAEPSWLQSKDPRWTFPDSPDALRLGVLGAHDPDKRGGPRQGHRVTRALSWGFLQTQQFGVRIWVKTLRNEIRFLGSRVSNIRPTWAGLPFV